MDNGLSSHQMFKICACLNPSAEDYNNRLGSCTSSSNIFIGCRPIAPGTLVTVDSMFTAMRPGNAAILQYNNFGVGMGHYVTMWQQRNERDELWYFYYNSIGDIKLFAGTSTALLERDISIKSSRTPAIFDGGYRRVMYIFSLRERLQEREEDVINAVKNFSNHSNRVMKDNFKLDIFQIFLSLRVFCLEKSRNWMFLFVLMYHRNKLFIFDDTSMSA